MNRNLTRRAFMGASALAAAGAALPVLSLMPKGAKAHMTPETVDLESLPPLREVAAKKGILYGAAVGTPNLKKDARFREAVIRECNVLVAEYETKWNTLMPEARGAWHFDKTDELVLFAEDNGMKTRGHTLVWHGSFPDWAKAALKEGQGPALMEEYIQTLVSRYKGRIFSWDVVNEAIQPKDGLEGGLRKTPWFEAMGPEYIERAFRLAHEADPGAQLVYSDFRIEVNEERARNALSLFRKMKEKNVPIHAVALHAHLDMKEKFTPLANFCKEIKSLGMDVLVSEFDVWDNYFVYDEMKSDQEIAERAKEFLDTVFSATTPQQIITWGLSDKYSWLSSSRWNERNRADIPGRGLPLDRLCRRKQLWKSIYDAVSRA